MARSLDFKILARWLILENRQHNPARRRFFSSTAVGGLASLAVLSTATSGCGTLDRWVLGDDNRLENEVLILGGGLAGLTAAYQLKKDRIPYRVYEASNRLGGRVQTLAFFNSDRQFAEAGAEFFDDSHHELLQLCQELGLKAQDVSYETKADRGVYWLGNKVVGEKEFRKALKPLALKLAQLRADILVDSPGTLQLAAILNSAQAKATDAESLASVIEPFRQKMNPAVIESFENLCKSEWGVETNEINLLQFLVRLTEEEKSLATAPSKMFRVEGGTSQLIQVLGDRVQGIMPGFTLKLEYQLVEVKRRSGGYSMTFKTSTGHETVWAKQVICTLPWSILKDVEGIRDLELSPLETESIVQSVYATHSKAIASFKDPVWKHRTGGPTASQGVFRGQLKGQNYWDSSRGQSGNHGLLTSQRGGKRDLDKTITEGAAECAEDLQHFFKDLGTSENFHWTHWLKKPFAKGSRHHSLPGRYLRHLELLSAATEKSTFIFAGEHMSFHHAGSMNGAVETALMAAAQVLKMTPIKATT